MWSGFEESDTSSVRIAYSMIRYLKREERIERPLAAHVGVRRNVWIGAVQFQQTTQDEDTNQRRPSSDSGDV